MFHYSMFGNMDNFVLYRLGKNHVAWPPPKWSFLILDDTYIV